MLIVYTYASCDTCRRATKWLRAQGIAFEEKPIRETPPTGKELQAMLAKQGGELRRLFNIAGQDYRALGLKDKWSAMGEAEAIALLAGNGNLVKRPFLLGADVGLVGFEEAEWTERLGTR